jgi:hypothetical protein
MPRKNPHAVALGRRGGRVSTRVKAKAARRNAKLGGRPMKFKAGDRVTVNDKAPGDYEGRTGTIRRYVDRGQYDVWFGNDGTGNAAEGVLMSWWLDRVDKK